jgi:hypothetical protein
MDRRSSAHRAMMEDGRTATDRAAPIDIIDIDTLSD